MKWIHVHCRSGLRNSMTGALVWKNQDATKHVLLWNALKRVFFKKGSIIRCFYKRRQLTAEMPLGIYWLVSSCSNEPLVVVDWRLPAGQPHLMCTKSLSWMVTTTTGLLLPEFVPDWAFFLLISAPAKPLLDCCFPLCCHALRQVWINPLRMMRSGKQVRERRLSKFKSVNWK